MNLFEEGSIFKAVGTVQGARTAVIFLLTVIALMLIFNISQINIFKLFKIVGKWLLNMSSKLIHGQEAKYHRELAIGKIDEQRKKVIVYRFLNDLIIDLGMKSKGATPYEFLFLTLIGSLLAALLVCQVLFGAMALIVVMYPLAFAAIMCLLYTKANLAHDSRIEAVIEAENIISNNIKDGVVVAVKNSINVLPGQVRGDFVDFLDNIEHKNYHVRLALVELNNHLGYIADDFIKKCIVFEVEEEHGIVGMFKDVVEINNIIMEERIEMKRKFEETKIQFISGSTMIFMFLAGTMALYENVSHFYLKTPIGQIILCVDLLILIGEFVYITYLRAQNL